MRPPLLPPNAGDLELTLRAVLARHGPVSLSPEDLDAAGDLELVVREAPFGDPEGSKIVEAVAPVDPRRAAIARALSPSFTRHSGDELSEAIDRVLEELDRA